MRRDSGGVSEWHRVADTPDGIVLKRHRDLEGLHNLIWVRRAFLALLVAIVLLGLANVFGQRPGGTHVTSPAADLEVYAPARVRSGVLFEARFTIRARRDLKRPALLLSPGWGEGMSMNTVEPSPLGQGSRNGDFLFTLGHIPEGHVYRLFLQFQVNPTNVGKRRQDVALYDGNTRLLTVHHSITVWP
jgi:hypothetical protein